MIIKIAMLIVPALAGLVLLAIGAALVLLGVLRKNRSRWVAGAVATGFATILLVGTAVYGIYKAVGVGNRVAKEAPEMARRASNSVLEGLADSLVSVKPVRASETPCAFLSESAVTGFQGAMTEVPGLYAYHLKYKADRNFILDRLERMPFDRSNSSVGSADVKPAAASRDEADENLTLLPPERQSLPFWKPEQVQNGEYYTFFRFPWQHTLLFDPGSGEVYHYISEVRP